MASFSYWTEGSVLCFFCAEINFYTRYREGVANRFLLLKSDLQNQGGARRH